MGRITRHARMQPCTLRLQGCNGDPSTTVFAHAPSVNRGGMRDEDWWGCFACSECHDRLDGRTPHSIPQEVVLDRLNKAIHETQRILFKDDLLRIVE